MTSPGVTGNIDAHERGRRRDRALIMAVLTSFGVRAITAVASLAAVGVIARDLAPAELGLVLALVTLWFLITGTTELGVGAITATRLAAAHGRDDQDEMRRHTDHAFAVLGGIGLTVALGGIACALLLPWASWLTHGELAQTSVAPAVAVTFTAAGGTLAGAVGDAILNGLQRQTASQLRAAVGAVAPLPACVVAVALDLPIWTFVVASVGLPALESVLNTLWVVGVEYPHLRPRWAQVSATGVRDLLTVSGYFALMRIGDAMSAGTGTIVVATVRGPADAAVFGVAFRIYAFGTSIISVAGTKVWLGIAEAISRGDLAWAKRRYYQSLVLVAAASVIGTFVLILAGPTFSRVWVGPDLAPPTELFAALGLMLFASCVIGQLIVMLLAVERVRPTGLLFASITIPTLAISIVLTDALGPTGAALVPAIVYAALILPCTAWQCRRTLAAVSG